MHQNFKLFTLGKQTSCMSEVQNVESKEFEKTIYHFRLDGIVEVEIKDNAYIELADALKQEEYLKSEKSSYLPLKLLIVAGEGASVSKEVRDFANQPEATSIILAEAIVVKSYPQKIMANFIKNFYKTPMPIKTFSDKESAVSWLLNFE